MTVTCWTRKVNEMSQWLRHSYEADGGVKESAVVVCPEEAVK